MKQKVKDYWVAIYEDGSVQIQSLWDAEHNSIGDAVSDAEENRCDVSSDEWPTFECCNNPAYND